MRRSAILLAGASLAVLLCLAWLGSTWLFGAGRVDSSGAAPANTTARSGDGPTAAAATADEESPAGLEPQPRQPADERSISPPPALVSRPCEVLVLEQATGRPLLEARVRACPFGGQGPGSEVGAWELDSIDAWMDAHGEPVEVQPGGLALVRLPQDGAVVVVGDTPGLWGRALLRSGAEEPQRLELVPDRNVEVRTVDPVGSPVAGVPVALRAFNGAWMESRLVQPSDDQGRAELLHLGFRLSQERHLTLWSIGVDALLDEPAEQRIDPHALPPGPVVLVVPATGAVEVAVDVLPGAPAPEGGEVSMARVEGDRLVRPSVWSRPPRKSAPIRAGLARIEHVGLGLELSIEARGPGSAQPTRRRARGPALPGEVVRVELVLGWDHPVLRLRLLDSEGRPLPGIDVRAELEQSSAFASASTVFHQRTDAQGVLFLDLDAHSGEARERTLRLAVAASEGVVSGHAELDLSREFPEGLTDLGDVRLVAAELLAAGQVVDSSGAPVPAAGISVEVPEEWGGDVQSFLERGDLEALADEQGRFEIRGRVESASLRLAADASGWAGEPVVVPAGSTGVVLRLGRAGSLEGRVLVDGGVQLEDLKVLLDPARGDAQERLARSSWTPIRDDGSFALDEVFPGPYELAVSLLGSGDELVRLEGLAVPDGAPCTDPRLAAIDLRGRLVSFRLELVPPRAGQSVSGVVLARPVGAAAGGPEEQARFFMGEQVPITAEAAALDLDVLAQGFRRVRLEAVRSDVRIELEEGPCVRLRLPSDVELPPPPRYLKAFVGAEQDFWTLGYMQDAVFGPDRELVLHVAQPGTLQVLWMLEERREGTTSSTTLGYAEPQMIEVLDVGGEQVFVVAPYPQAYAEALKSWK